VLGKDCPGPVVPAGSILLCRKKKTNAETPTPSRLNAEKRELVMATELRLISNPGFGGGKIREQKGRQGREGPTLAEISVIGRIPHLLKRLVYRT